MYTTNCLFEFCFNCVINPSTGQLPLEHYEWQEEHGYDWGMLSVLWMNPMR